ncbi:MAG: hypothetical protein TE42_03380 [Candidatus Synechococcus spongiarum SP3]|uniref:Uncharacterized protein n=1 Tax=Candidatus Synechococcus spongiarum SP3 TaxID=1604020 RepID=A0A0G2HLY8_9SYNE|nr:MAG: hypothetical protein TE42_03380 [Candidatus Synechococcus spongiarum SP3]
MSYPLGVRSQEPRHRVWLLPTNTRVSMSTVLLSSAARVVRVMCSSGLASWRQMATGVLPERSANRILRASSNCQTRSLERGL